MKGAEFIQDQRSYDLLSTLAEGMVWKNEEKEVRDIDSITLIPASLPSFRSILEVIGSRVIPTFYSEVEHEIHERARSAPVSIVCESNVNEIAIHFDIPSLTTSLHFPFEGSWYPSIRSHGAQLEKMYIDVRGQVDYVTAWMFPDKLRAEQISMQGAYNWDRKNRTLEIFQTTTHDFGRDPKQKSTQYNHPHADQLIEQIDGIGRFIIPTSLSETEFLSNLLFPYRVNDIDIYTGETKRTSGYEMFGIRWEPTI